MNKRFFPLGASPFCGAPKLCIGFSALASGISSIGSGLAPIVGGFVSRKNTKDTNKMNLQIAREANEAQAKLQADNNQFQHDMAIEMFERENEYNNPTAQMERMRAAGLNPYMGNTGGSMVQSSSGDIATPTGTAPLPVHAPTMQVEPSVLGTAFQNFDVLSRAFKNIADARKTGLDTSLLQAEFNDMVRQESEKARILELERKIKGVDLSFLPQRYTKELDQLDKAISLAIAQTATEEAKKDNYDRDTALKKVQERLERFNIKLTKSQIRRIDELLPLEQETERSKALANKGAAAAGYAAAEKSREESETIRSTREHIIEKAKEDAELTKQSARAQLFRNYFDVKTMDDRIEQVGKALELTEAEIRQVKESARLARREGNWMWFDKTLGKLLGSAGVVAAAYISKSPTVALGAASGAASSSAATTPPVPFN